MITTNKFTSEEFSAKTRVFAETLYNKINEKQTANVKVSQTGPRTLDISIEQQHRIDTWVFDHLQDGSIQTTRVHYV